VIPLRVTFDTSTFDKAAHPAFSARPGLPHCTRHDLLKRFDSNPLAWCFPRIGMPRAEEQFCRISINDRRSIKPLALYREPLLSFLCGNSCFVTDAPSAAPRLAAGVSGMAKRSLALLQESLSAAHRTGALKPKGLERWRSTPQCKKSSRPSNWRPPHSWPNREAQQACQTRGR
jgi:hypothetical protein